MNGDSNFWFLNLFSPTQDHQRDSIRNFDRPSPRDEQPAQKRRRGNQPQTEPTSSQTKNGRNRGRGQGSTRRGGDGPKFNATAAGVPLRRQQQPPPDWGAKARRGPSRRGFPDGQSICFDFHSGKHCDGTKCYRSHACPKLLSSGSFCHGPHKLQDCKRD